MQVKKQKQSACRTCPASANPCAPFIARGSECKHTATRILSILRNTCRWRGEARSAATLATRSRFAVRACPRRRQGRQAQTVATARRPLGPAWPAGHALCLGRARVTLSPCPRRMAMPVLQGPPRQGGPAVPCSLSSPAAEAIGLTGCTRCAAGERCSHGAAALSPQPLRATRPPAQSSRVPGWRALWPSACHCGSASLGRRAVVGPWGSAGGSAPRHAARRR